MKALDWGNMKPARIKLLRSITHCLMANVFHLCLSCGSKMTQQDPSLYLNDGQKREQALGTVLYRVWKCSGCPSCATTFRRTLRTRTYHQCPECGYFTFRQRITLIAWPTQDSPGKRLVEQDCVHCLHHLSRYDDLTSIPSPRSVHRPFETFDGYYSPGQASRRVRRG
jgi:hypothetical protein